MLIQNENEVDLRCYLLRNSDLMSLKDPEFSNNYAFTAGLQMASFYQNNLNISDDKAISDFQNIVQFYMNQADGFGTTITLEVPGSTMIGIHEMSKALRFIKEKNDHIHKLSGVISGIIMDEAFPIGDGFISESPVPAYMWVLGDANSEVFRQLVRGWRLADYPAPSRPFNAQFQKNRSLEDGWKIVLLSNADRPRLFHGSGLANAHAHHAGVQFVSMFDYGFNTSKRISMAQNFLNETFDEKNISNYHHKVDCQSVSEETMHLLVERARAMELNANIVIDPTYPVMDGFTVECPTMAWYLVENNSEKAQSLQDIITQSKCKG